MHYVGILRCCDYKSSMVKNIHTARQFYLMYSSYPITPNHYFFTSLIDYCLQLNCHIWPISVKMMRNDNGRHWYHQTLTQAISHAWKTPNKGHHYPAVIGKVNDSNILFLQNLGKLWVSTNYPMQNLPVQWNPGPVLLHTSYWFMFQSYPALVMLHPDIAG